MGRARYDGSHGCLKDTSGFLSFYLAVVNETIWSYLVKYIKFGGTVRISLVFKLSLVPFESIWKWYESTKKNLRVKQISWLQRAWYVGCHDSSSSASTHSEATWNEPKKNWSPRGPQLRRGVLDCQDPWNLYRLGTSSLKVEHWECSYKRYLDKKGKQDRVFWNHTPEPDLIDSFIKRYSLSSKLAFIIFSFNNNRFYSARYKRSKLKQLPRSEYYWWSCSQEGCGPKKH